MSKKGKDRQERRRWVLIVVLLSFGLSVVMSLLTSLFVDSAGLLMALTALITLVMIGIVTDAIGIAVTSASEQPFISMASKRIRGARQALYLIRRAQRVSSVLNDVVGDIVGIVAGSAGSVIAAVLSLAFGLRMVLASLLMTASISSLMIGGKAYGKGIAIEHSERIVLFVGRTMAALGINPGMKRGKDGKRKHS